MTPRPLALLAALIAQPALANGPCLPRADLVKTLTSDYSEQLKGRGLRDEARLFEFFISADGESWTMLQTYANGVSCVMASGTTWLEEELVFAPEGLPG